MHGHGILSIQCIYTHIDAGSKPIGCVTYHGFDANHGFDAFFASGRVKQVYIYLQVLQVY